MVRVAVLAALMGAAFSAPMPEPKLMNEGGVPYSISNPPGSTKDWVGTPGTYSTNFINNAAVNVKAPVEHFDVYGEVQTQYSQVYWTRNAPINLPKELVERFDGKVMAITGYEIDQVTHTAPVQDSTSSGDILGGFSCYPDCSDSDKSVPIYNAYNHHYFSWLTGKDSEVYDLETPVKTPNPTYTAIRDLPNDHGFPTNIVFKENPGGEFRKSYHGYPSGYAQLIHSPTQWLVEPMQIDTHNRDYGINDQVGLKLSFLPKTDHNNMTDYESKLSPLIECPCSDRITRTAVSTSTVLSSSTCAASKIATITSAQECTAAVGDLAAVSGSSTVSNASLPAGCSMVPDGSGTYQAVFNSDASSTAPCGSGTGPMLGHSELGGGVSMALAHDGTTANISLSGPDGVWFGVGFAATTMKDAPYAIIVDGTGKATERRLVEHGPGSVLPASVTVLETSVTSGVRTVVLSRAVKGASAQHYSLPTTPGEINMISAVGNTAELAYHKTRTGGKIALLPSETPACVCQPQVTHTMSYMNTSSWSWEGYDCFDEPRSDMLRHGDGTGRDVPNAACDSMTYHGGLKCCSHTFFLTDVDQAPLIPNKTDTYYLKWRYYFQEYTPKTETAPPSHGHLHHWVFLIDQAVNDYEEDNANYGESSIGKITAHVTGATMGLEDTPKGYTTITPYVMTPHCHAPSCIREEFWNADTGEIICNVSAMYGGPQYGPLTAPFNEPNYITIPPCIFGHQPGLQKPFTLTAATNITAIKYFNNTYRHLGQMAQWTGLMKYDADPY